MRQAVINQMSSGWLPVISMTTTLAVTGDCVAAARKAAVQSRAMSPCSTVPSDSAHRPLPMPAPVLSAGVKMPPGIPVQ